MQVPRRVLFWQDKRKESRWKSMKVLTTAERQASLCLSLCACVHARAHATTEASACVLQDYLLPWRPLLTLHSLFPLHTFRSSVALKQTLCVLESKRDSEQTFHELVKKNKFWVPPGPGALTVSPLLPFSPGGPPTSSVSPCERHRRL